MFLRLQSGGKNFRSVFLCSLQLYLLIPTITQRRTPVLPLCSSQMTWDLLFRPGTWHSEHTTQELAKICLGKKMSKQHLREMAFFLSRMGSGVLSPAAAQGDPDGPARDTWGQSRQRKRKLGHCWGLVASTFVTWPPKAGHPEQTNPVPKPSWALKYTSSLKLCPRNTKCIENSSQFYFCTCSKNPTYAFELPKENTWIP